MNRTVSWGENAIIYEADRRHGENVVDMMNLVEGKGAVTPGVNAHTMSVEEI